MEKHKQCKEYYKALERGDRVGARLLYIRPGQLSVEVYLATARFNKSVANMPELNK
jgi:hypothetical protein